MKDIKQIYNDLCRDYSIPFEIINNVKAYDDSTLFCPAGMQKYKELYKDNSYVNTVANIQSCLRINDIDELGDLSHLLCFNMIGLFSFRDWSIGQAISFFLTFINRVGLELSYVTIHPDRKEWVAYYPSSIPVRFQEDCKWSDGNIGGYCTEFFITKDNVDIEIGNIVNTLDTCIDVGFGLERLELLVNDRLNLNKEEALQNAAKAILDAGYTPSNKKQGYVLRKILRELRILNSDFDCIYYKQELTRYKNMLNRYEKVKDKYKDKTNEWWFDTYGVDLTELNYVPNS